MRLGFLVGLCALAGCSPPAPQTAARTADSSAISDSGFRPLTDGEISALLSGAYIREIVPPSLQDLSTPEQFNRDGTYIRYADNAELEGHYTVRDGTVCVKVDIHPEYCRFIAVDKAGQYFIGRSLLPADLKPISRFDAQVRRLTTSELKSLLVGYYIKRGELYARYPTLDFSEHFRKSGEYLLIDHGSSDTGTYDIRNDAVCVKLPRKPETCRHVFRDETGRILIHNPKSSKKPIVINLFKEIE